MSKQCESYEIKVMEDPVRLWVKIRPFKNDVWSGFRILINLGKRAAKELNLGVTVGVDKALQVEAATILPDCIETSVTLTPLDKVSKETMENVAHSLYLWLEHPEKY